MYTNINHIQLKSDLVNGKVKPEWLIGNGRVITSPPTWAIDGDMDNYDSSYLYQSKSEYLQDIATLQIDLGIII